MPKLVHSLRFTDHSKEKTVNREQLTVNRNSTGFTLIELLVVIAIIGILASLATFSYTDSQKKSRDTRRKSDLTAIQKALELAKQDSAGNYSYPICNPYVSGQNYCLADADSKIRVGSTNLATTYIKSIPKDPKNDTGYGYYTYASNGTTSCTASATCTTFKLVACLENTKDPQKDPTASQNSTVCTDTTNTKSYTISNL